MADDLIGNEKLLAARAEIEAIIKRYDIAAHVVLHCPGFAELFSDYTPSYSRLTIKQVDEHGFTMHLKSEVAEYGGDREAQRRDLEATANMVSSIAEALARDAIGLLKVTERVDKALGAEHTETTKVVRKPGSRQ
ncbi:MAG TPA: hypothetical protein VMS92_06955 [Mycobacterium sp.]|nr:hypothetical protein [Mycobacterium sp.]